MPDVTQGRVHRFRDHEVAGINWRPTRFVDEVPGSRVCGLCRMIPKRILLLPCSHTLCEACHATNSQGVGGRCPLDQETFEEAECFGHDFPSRKSNALKVYCWNEARGCEFESTVKDMLQHYEKECTFHAVESSRCGEEVLHRNLSTHYVTECITGASPARAGDTSSPPIPLTLRDAEVALEELKTLLMDANYEETMPAIQSRINELLEKVRNQESRMAEVYEEVRGNAETAQGTAATSSSLLHEPTSRRTPKTPTDSEASTSSSPLSCSQNMSMPQKPLLFPGLRRDVTQIMRKTSSQDYPQHSIVNPKPIEYQCDLELITAPSTTRAWREVRGSVKYIVKFNTFTFKNPLAPLAGGSAIAKITVWHTVDACFEVVVFYTARYFLLKIQFFGRIAGSGQSPPSFVVNARDRERDRKHSLMSTQGSSYFLFHGEKWVSSYCTFREKNDCLDKLGFFRNGIEFEIELSHIGNAQAGQSCV